MFSADSELYNPNTGFDMVYQENKVYNLKLAAKTLDGLLIKPGETFSFWKAVRRADKHLPYKDGLVVKSGTLCVSYGGGLCQMSNLLFWVFLHSPLIVVERHAHRIKEFPAPPCAVPEGVDATVSEGWLDLKVKNDTEATFQIGISFDRKNITGSLFSDKAPEAEYEIEGRGLAYFRENRKVYQSINVYRREKDIKTRKALTERLLYENVCAIGYQLPEGTLIFEKEKI
jgi:vancomycin resistance protein VanW